MDDKTKLSTECYKGVRDFYPEDMAIQNYIFDTWKKVAKEAGFVEYSASLLEPAELYRAKSGDELVNDQMFTFTDKGGREVALRPEMTPTFARMVAAKRKSLKFPIRWFSIPNLFRYEKPQRGRRREHWQLNCDIVGNIGKTSVEADVEIISLAYNIMKAFGARDDQFEIRINSRKILEQEFAKFNLTPDQQKELRSILDRKNKMSKEEFDEKINSLVGQEFEISNSPSLDLQEVIDKLSEKNIKVIFDPEIIRGFDYYTGMVFEVFDISPENNRSLFGGGRYDNLLEIFGVEPAPTVGFGMGDITIRDFLETHKLPLCEN